MRGLSFRRCRTRQSDQDQRIDTVSATSTNEWRRWPIVAGAALGLGSGGSVFVFISSLFVLPLSQEFGWTRGQIAAAATTGLLTAVLAPFIGRLADRHGARPVILGSIAMMSLGYLTLATMRGSLTMYYVGMFLMGLGGVGTTGMTYTRIITGWYSRHRGLALGISLAGVSVFAFILPPLLSRLIDALSWRAGYVALAAIGIGVGVPAVIWLLREPPPATPFGSSALTAGAAGISQGWHTYLRCTARKPVFWLLFISMILVNVAGSPLLAQLTPLLSDRGIPIRTAAGLLSAYAAAVLIGRLIGGYLIDRVSPPSVAAVAMLAPAVGCLMLIDTDSVMTTVVLAVLLLGLSQGAEMDLLAFFIARHLGLRDYSTTFAVMIAGVVIGNVLGALLFGFTHDLTGTYGIALAAAAVCFLGGAASLYALRWQPLIERDPITA